MTRTEAQLAVYRGVWLKEQYSCYDKSVLSLCSEKSRLSSIANRGDLFYWVSTTLVYERALVLPLARNRNNTLGCSFLELKKLFGSVG